MRHSVYSQVMQQLELHAAGSLKTHLRESLTVALAELTLTVVYAARAAGANTRETVVSAVVAIAFAGAVVFLKVAIH